MFFIIIFVCVCAPGHYADDAEFKVVRDFFYLLEKYPGLLTSVFSLCNDLETKRN